MFSFLISQSKGFRRIIPSQNNNNNISFQRWNSILTGIIDRYNGITIDSNSLPQSDSSFNSILQNSLTIWKKDGIRGVWFKIPSNRTNLLPIAISQGFTIHHAQPSYVMVINWLSETDPNALPEQSHHQIGVGGFIHRTDTNQILLIKEQKNRTYKNQSNTQLSSSSSTITTSISHSWKMPGGLQNRGEQIHEAIVREVFEETGVSTKFVSVFGFRHKNNYLFNDDDIYFFCRLSPINTEIKKCQREISECEWIDVKDVKNLISDNQIFPLQSEAIRIGINRLDRAKDEELCFETIDSEKKYSDKWKTYGRFNLYRIKD